MTMTLRSSNIRLRKHRFLGLAMMAVSAMAPVPTTAADQIAPRAAGGTMFARETCDASCTPGQASTAVIVARLHDEARKHPGSPDARMSCANAAALARESGLPGLANHTKEIWNCRD